MSCSIVGTGGKLLAQLNKLFDVMHVDLNIDNASLAITYVLFIEKQLSQHTSIQIIGTSINLGLALIFFNSFPNITS